MTTLNHTNAKIPFRNRVGQGSSLQSPLRTGKPCKNAPKMHQKPIPKWRHSTIRMQKYRFGTVSAKAPPYSLRSGRENHRKMFQKYIKNLSRNDPSCICECKYTVSKPCRSRHLATVSAPDRKIMQQYCKNTSKTNPEMNHPVPVNAKIPFRNRVGQGASLLSTVPAPDRKII